MTYENIDYLFPKEGKYYKINGLENLKSLTHLSIDFDIDRDIDYSKEGNINGITSDEILSILNDDWHRLLSLIFKLRIKDRKKENALRVKFKEMERENKIQTKVLYGKTYWRKLKNE